MVNRSSFLFIDEKLDRARELLIGYRWQHPADAILDHGEIRLQRRRAIAPCMGCGDPSSNSLRPAVLNPESSYEQGEDKRRIDTAGKHFILPGFAAAHCRRGNDPRRWTRR